MEVHKTKHTGDKPYECDVCKKRFWQSIILKRHKTTHSGSKPYQCDVCKKSFSRREYLNCHKSAFAGLSELFRVGVCFDKVGGCGEGTV
jgi:KRAB domain-containing zinc finger protein